MTKELSPESLDFMKLAVEQLQHMGHKEVEVTPELLAQLRQQNLVHYAEDGMTFNGIKLIVKKDGNAD